jgi:hypothetical protein
MYKMLKSYMRQVSVVESEIKERRRRRKEP